MECNVHETVAHTRRLGLVKPRLLLLLRLPQGIVFQPLDVRRRLFCTVSQIHTRSFYLQKIVLFVPFVYTSILTTPTRARDKEKIVVFMFRYVENKPNSTHSLTYKHTHSQTISATSLQQTNNNNTERKLLLNTTQPCSIYLFTISHYKRKRFEV